MDGGLHAETEALLDGFELEVQSRDVLEWGRDRDCSAHDCEFIALAKRLDAKPVTMNKKLVKAFPDRAVSLAC